MRSRKSNSPPPRLAAGSPAQPPIPTAEPARETAPDDDLLALVADEDEAGQVFRHSALLAFGEAGPHLQKGFAVLQAVALEDGRCHRGLDRDDLFRAEAAALAQDLRLAQTRAAHIALQGPLDPARTSQLRTCAVMADVARELRTLRQSLEAANA